MVDVEVVAVGGERIRVGGRAPALCALGVLLGLGGCSAPPPAFDTPELAVQALVDSATDEARAEELLGPGGFELLRSGDEVADRADLEAVRAMIREKVAFEADGEDRRTALLGRDAWPLPIPLVRAGNGWSFDVEAGRDEILNRRIGRNELSTIATLQACVEAQQEYAAKGRDGRPACFAARWRSSAGKRDGLYWPAAPGEEPSPLGELVAAAAAEGYANTEGAEPEPYHGYHYRLLTAQGEHAPGGARSYADGSGALRNGFAIVAWPATYGNSGVMTFLVNQVGIVFECDLGADTARMASAMTAYDPDPAWRPVRD